MNATEQFRFDELYLHHLVALKLQGKARKAIEAFALRRLADHIDRGPDNLTTDELRDYFAAQAFRYTRSAITQARTCPTGDEILAARDLSLFVGHWALRVTDRKMYEDAECTNEKQSEGRQNAASTMPRICFHQFYKHHDASRV